jgi:hypothetical protein
MRQEISDDMGEVIGSHAVSAAFVRLFQLPSTARAADSFARQSMPCFRLISTHLRVAGPKAPRRLDVVLISDLIQHTIASHGALWQRRSQVSSEQVHLHCRTQALLVPPVGHFAGSGLLHRSPCLAPPASPLPCAVAALKPGES